MYPGMLVIVQKNGISSDTWVGHKSPVLIPLEAYTIG